MRIGLVGKYVELQDAYISVVEALRHAGYGFDTEIEVKWINSEEVTAENAAELLGMSMESLFQVVSVTVALTGKLKQSRMHVTKVFRFSGSALVCN